jgi:hypothetical protein
MFRKVAIALVAASMLTAPVMAKAPATSTKPATASTSSATVKTVKTVKADKTVFKHHKHARVHRNIWLSRHKHRDGVKYAHHFNAGKGHKAAGTSGKVVSAKPATRSN